MIEPRGLPGCPPQTLLAGHHVTASQTKLPVADARGRAAIDHAIEQVITPDLVVPGEGGVVLSTRRDLRLRSTSTSIDAWAVG